jgi:hypothetical protein
VLAIYVVERDRGRAVAPRRACARYNTHAVEHLSSLWKALRAVGLNAEVARFAVTDTIEKIGGAKPKSFEAFVREGQRESLAKSA